ncbi:MAG: phosphoribosylglycinamide formyltransferase [Leptospira sp.]|nr:phosphoribosylglycinamide formyltransferase [Leptospira sp.]
MGKLKRLVFLASGRGSNFSACVEAIRKKKLPVQILALVSDNPGAKALDAAKSFQIPTKVLDFTKYDPKTAYHKDLLATLEELAPDLIVACGYMRILKPDIIKAFPNRILNVHPSLLPAFPGLDAQRQAIEYGAKITGCTVHFIEEGVDTGPIILQKSVEIDPNETEKELSLRILKEEHKILPLAIQLFCENKLKIQGRKVKILK